MLRHVDPDFNHDGKKMSGPDIRPVHRTSNIVHLKACFLPWEKQATA